MHKSDAHDVLSIIEAAQRPKIHFVPVKTVPQQDLQLLGRVRERLVAQRTALINQARGFAQEYGVSFPKRRDVLMAQLPEALANASNELSPVAREALAELLAQIRELDARLKTLMQRLSTLASEDSAINVAHYPGHRPLDCARIVRQHRSWAAVQKCTQLLAWVGLIPKQHSTGARTQLGAITKSGDRNLRVLLIHGARAVIVWPIATRMLKVAGSVRSSPDEASTRRRCPGQQAHAHRLGRAAARRHLQMSKAFRPQAAH